MATMIAQRSSTGFVGRKPAARRVVAPRAALLTNVKVPKTTPQQEQQKSAPKAGFELGFTRDNEVFVGRLAMTGFAASVVGEVLSGGQGALAQLGYNFGLPTYQIGLFIAGLVSFNLIYGLLPTAATYKPEAQQAIKSEVGPIQDPKITIFNIKKFFGVTDWGFTPQNELFAGRMAQLGFAASLIGELATGLGPLGQLSAESGVPIQTLQFALAAWATFMACTAVDKLAVKKSGSSSTGKTTKSKTIKQTVAEKVL
jgi:photosystem II protein